MTTPTLLRDKAACVPVERFTELVAKEAKLARLTEACQSLLDGAGGVLCDNNMPAHNEVWNVDLERVREAMEG